jgi:copper chaperone CopZ
MKPDLPPSAAAPLVAFVVADMDSARCAGVVTRALLAVDRTAQVRVDLPTRTVEIRPVKASARQLGDAIRQAGYMPAAA